MKYVIKMHCLLIFTICLFGEFGCSSSTNLFVSKQNPQSNSLLKSQEKSVVLSLCTLIDNPYQYHQKVVELKTTLYRVGNITNLGDENCVQRHSLFDVEFSSDFESSVCRRSDVNYEKMCLMVKASNQKQENINYAINANIIGYFEYYESRTGFTSNGLRFRFIVQEIESIEKIMPVESKKIE